MKRLLLATALLATPAFAETPPTVPAASVYARDYRLHDQQKAALRWELAYQLASALDAAETIYCLRTDPTCEEANPLMGKHPSTAKIILTKAAFGLIHYEFTHRLARHNPRAAMRISQISFALQGAVVALNMRVIF